MLDAANAHWRAPKTSEPVLYANGQQVFQACGQRQLYLELHGIYWREATPDGTGGGHKACWRPPESSEINLVILQAWY